MVYLTEYACYREVLKHRLKCEKWKQSKLCLECFGGGLTIFTTKLLDEINHGEYSDE